MFTQIPDHVQQALARLITQYQSSPNFKAIITAFIEQVQTVEDALADMNTLRYIALAAGIQLDHLGEIVGITRPAGMADDDYRNLILAKVKTNNSCGQPEQIIQLYQLLTMAEFVILFEGHHAEIVLEAGYAITSQAQADNLITLVKGATAAGVRVNELVSFDPDASFSYDGPLPGQGYDDGTSTQGGGYAEGWSFIGGGFAYDGNDDSAFGYGTEADPLAGGAYLT